MQPDSFVHLHVHSQFTLDDGVPTVEELADCAVRSGMRALALTDRNSLAGVVRLHDACMERSLQPVFGAELDLLPLGAVKYAGRTYRQVVLAENEGGFANLTALVSLARRRETPDAPPHMTLEELSEKGAGLIVFNGAPRSELRALLAKGDIDALAEHVEWLREQFGPERLVFELSNFGDKGTNRANDYLTQLANFLGAQLVATNDVHYILPEDDFARRFLRETPINGFIYPRSFVRDTQTRHFTTVDEMVERLPRHTQAIAATAQLAERCQFSLIYERRHFPVHDFERGFDAESDLWDRAFSQAALIFGKLSEEQKNRLNVELDYIRRHGLADFYHLLWRISQHLAAQNITRGAGQGRLLTSLVAYVLGLTEIDPIKSQLNFFGEQSVGAHPPVFSIALPSRSFDQVFRYLRETYGANRVARVGRHPACNKGKLFVDLCEWAQLPRSRTNELMRQNILDGRGRQPTRLADLLARTASSISPKNPKFLTFLVSRLHPRLSPIVPEEGRVIISGEDLDRITPREDHAGGEVTQLDSSDLAAFGMPQIRLVTNPLINALDDALELIRVESGSEVNFAQIPIDDVDAFDLLAQGATNGVTPFQTATLKTLLRRTRPKTLLHLLKLKYDMAQSEGDSSCGDYTDVFMDCLLGYRCAYLKSHPDYQVSFMTAMLNNTFRNRHDFAILWREVSRLGIAVLPPSVNTSNYEFTQLAQRIQVGLVVVHHIGEKVFEEIAQIRKGGEFTDLLDLCRRTDPRLVTRPVLENLIRAGALDGFELPRARMLAALPSVLAAARPHGEESVTTPSLFDESGVKLAAPAPEPVIPDIGEFSLQRRHMEEKKATGFVLSTSPLAPYQDYIERCGALTPDLFDSLPEDEFVYMAGHIDHCDKEGPGLDSDSAMILDLDGLTVLASYEVADKHGSAITSDDPVLVSGRAAQRSGATVLNMTFCARLRDLAIDNRHAQKLILDLRDENRGTLKLIHAALRRYRGETRVETRGFQGRWSSRLLSRVEADRVFWCPPLEEELRQILGLEKFVLEMMGETNP